MVGPGAIRPLCRHGAAIRGSHMEPCTIRHMNQGRARVRTEHSSDPETRREERPGAAAWGGDGQTTTSFPALLGSPPVPLARHLLLVLEFYKRTLYLATKPQSQFPWTNSGSIRILGIESVLRQGIFISAAKKNRAFSSPTAQFCFKEFRGCLHFLFSSRRTWALGQSHLDHKRHNPAVRGEGFPPTPPCCLPSEQHVSSR